MGWGTGNIGGGSAGLNFKIVGGTTEPSAPKENTIWVMTEQIGAWYFSATQPENMQEWDVWFSVGTSSEVAFNALKKNVLQVYPLSAKQYANGLMNDVSVMIYQDGSWTEWWAGQLFQEGNVFESVTGGWEHVAWSLNASWVASEPDVEIGDTIKMTMDRSGRNYSGGLITKKRISMQGWNKLRVSCKQITLNKNTTYNSGLYITLTNTNKGTAYIGDSVVGQIAVKVSNTAFVEDNIVAEIPLDGLNGDDDEYFVLLQMLVGPSTQAAVISADIETVRLLK